MSASTSPIFTKTPDIQWITGITTANANFTLASGTQYQVFQATTGASGGNGAYVSRIRFRALGTNIATVARVWITNGGATGTTANFNVWDELSLPSTTANSAAALPTFELPLNFALPAGYCLVVTLGTTVAAGYSATVIGGEY